MFAWCHETRINHYFIEPCKTPQNAFIEPFNGGLRDEYLNESILRSIPAAREIISNWRTHYNNERPYSSSNYLTPIEYREHINQAAVNHPQ